MNLKLKINQAILVINKTFLSLKIVKNTTYVNPLKLFCYGDAIADSIKII